MVNSDNEIQVLKNGGKSQPNSPITLTAPGGKTQGSESSEDEREGKDEDKDEDDEQDSNEI